MATAVTVLCFAPHPEEMVRELARVTKPGGRVVPGELGRWSTWAAARRIRGWPSGGPCEGARFSTASELRRLLVRAGLGAQQVQLALGVLVLTGVDKYLEALAVDLVPAWVFTL